MIHIYMDKNVIAIEGHADYAEKGKDIVCASVSAILQTAQCGLFAIAQQYPGNIVIEMDMEVMKYDKG